MSEEIKLFNNNTEREHFETLADLFSIFVATENLEKAYIRDAISQDEYFSNCTKLIGQYKTILSSLPTEFSIKEFCSTYNLSSTAIHRLCEVGVPATTEHTTPAKSENNISQGVAQTVQDFITLMDALKLNYFAVDQLQPLLSNLMRSLAQIKTLSSTYKGKEKILNWLKKLNKMRAFDELVDDDIRQLSFDIDSAMNEFHQTLSNN